MKVILTGATGFIGGEVLMQLLDSPAITSIVCLSRRELPSTALPDKAKVVLMDDFKIYSPEVLAQLKGAEVCIWYVFSDFV